MKSCIRSLNQNKTPQFRYKKSFDYDKDPDKLDITDNSQQQEAAEPQVNQELRINLKEANLIHNDFSDYNEYREEASESPAHQDNENEQSGSDNNEDESPLKTEQEDDEAEGEGEGDNFPILFLDVNLGKDRVERLVVYDGDDPFKVAEDF